MGRLAVSPSRPLPAMIDKAPHADLRRTARIRAQVGTAAALGLCVLAFTVPTPPREAPTVAEAPPPPLVGLDIPQTTITPPAPPPPAPPPPREVPDDTAVEDAIASMEFEFTDEIVPVGPPSVPGPPPPPPPPPAGSVEPPPPPPDPVRVDSTFIVVEEDPELIGGLDGLQSRVEYPEFARRAGIEGTVYVQFVVDEQGRVSEARAVRGNEQLAQSAVKAVAESQFRPGMQRGRPVKVRYTLPVRFVLR